MSNNTVGCKSPSSLVGKIKFLIEKVLSLSLSDVKETEDVKHFTKADKVKLDSLPVDFGNRIAALKAAIASDDTALDSFQEIADFVKQNRVLLSALTLGSVAETEDYKHFSTADKLKLACLKCDASSVPPEVTLLGTNPQVLTRGDAYGEQGAKAKDNRNVLLNDVIQIDKSAVDTQTAGSYVVTYSVHDWEGREGTVTRTVLVQKDTLAPTLSLIGEATVQVALNEPYVELGATAIDALDGAITPVISGSVNSALEGYYTITYRATDSDGNSAVKTRLVLVVDRATISLVGEPSVTLELGEVWEDPGAVAHDPVNGSLTPVYQDTFKTDVVQDFIRTYVVPAEQTSAGLALSKTRTIHVLHALNDPVFHFTEALVEKDGYMYVKDSANAVGTFDGKLVYADGSAFVPTAEEYKADGGIAMAGKRILSHRIYYSTFPWVITEKHRLPSGFMAEVKIVNKANGLLDVYFKDAGNFVLVKTDMPHSILFNTYGEEYVYLDDYGFRVAGQVFKDRPNLLPNPTLGAAGNSYTKADGTLGTHWTSIGGEFRDASVYMIGTPYPVELSTSSIAVIDGGRYRFSVEILALAGVAYLNISGLSTKQINKVGVYEYEFTNHESFLKIRLSPSGEGSMLEVTNVSLKQII